MSWTGSRGGLWSSLIDYMGEWVFGDISIVGGMEFRVLSRRLSVGNTTNCMDSFLFFWADGRAIWRCIPGYVRGYVHAYVRVL